MNILILGGSIAGLFTAQALANLGYKVTVLDRSNMDADNRKEGVPQQTQAHIFLKGGLNSADRITPELSPKLLSAGAETVEVGRQWAFQFQKGWFKRADAGLDVIPCTRELLENTLRSIVLKDNSINLMAHTRILDVKLGVSETPSVSVEAIENNERVEKVLTANYVIDCLGSGSKAYSNLERDGIGSVYRECTKTYLGYATALFKNVDMPDGIKAILSAPKAPSLPRAGMVMKVENDLFQVTLNGYSKEYPPSDLEQFFAFSKSLRTDSVYNAIKNASLVSEIKPYRKNENHFNHYEKMKQWPKGFLLVGESVADQNPIYGAGMTCAAKSAELLAMEIKTGKETFTIQKNIQKIYHTPWITAKLEDARWPATEGADQQKVLSSITDRFMISATNSPLASSTFLRQLHIVDNQAALLNPKLILDIVLKGKGKPQNDDTPLPALKSI